ncbi:MAG: hypothetical protein IPM82_12345 [Saprospiraceae bacterium]|nr:hypothetical protein [Saprospiraceae bacterium]
MPAIISASAVVALTLVAVILYQGGFITELKQTLATKDKKLVFVSQQLVEQRLLTTELQTELQLYKDSVAVLQTENQRLHAKIGELKSTISKLNKIVQKHDDKVVELTAEINRLKEGGKKNAEKVKELEQKREELLTKMETIDKERIALLEDKRQNEQTKKVNDDKIVSLDKVAQEKIDQVADQVPQTAPAPIINQSPSEPLIATGPKVSEELQAAIVSRKQERLANIMAKTEVKFSSISLRNREGGNELKKIKSEDNWRYTFIDFDLDNVDKESIMDETFIIQVYDLDNNVVVPFNEKNLQFPNSEMGAIGYKFKYDGKPVSVRYLNTQPKEGRNYELRLIYFKNDLTFKLANGTKRIVEDGKVAVN